MKTDFSYINDGLFISLFPNNEQAKDISNEIWESLGGKIPVNIWPNVKHQLEEANYTINKSSSSSDTNEEILSQLLN